MPNATKQQFLWEHSGAQLDVAVATIMGLKSLHFTTTSYVFLLILICCPFAICYLFLPVRQLWWFSAIETKKSEEFTHVLRRYSDLPATRKETLKTFIVVAYVSYFAGTDVRGFSPRPPGRERIPV